MLNKQPRKKAPSTRVVAGPFNGQMIPLPVHGTLPFTLQSSSGRYVDASSQYRSNDRLVWAPAP